MNRFKQELESKIFDSLFNNYGKDNFDEFRFGDYSKYLEVNATTKYTKLKSIIKKIIGYKIPPKRYVENAFDLVKPYEEAIQRLWGKLETYDRELITSLMAYRVLGFTKVKLNRNCKEYWESIKKSIKLRETLY